MHKTRQGALAHLIELGNQQEWEALYRRTVLWDFATEARMGLQLAFLRPFAVPRMATVLLQAGHLAADPERRAYRTGILMHEVVAGGLESPRSRLVLRHINRAHRRPGILQEDLSYVLCALIVVPTRYLVRVGWRPLHPFEPEATLRFYQRLAELMNIQAVPDSYEQACQWLDHYENRRVARSAAGEFLGRQVLGVLQRRLPRALQPAAKSLFASQLGDDRILHALGLSPGSGVARFAWRQAYQLRAEVTKRRPAPLAPSFTPGQPAGRVYPEGYELQDLTG